jgi:enoyl-CoA hydratase
VIELSDQDGVAILRMADGKANAFSVDFCRAMTARFTQIAASPARAVIIIGSGRIFSAGVDLLMLIEEGVPYIREFLPALSTMLATVFAFPKPVVAAINGHAVAGGCVLACAADERLMARDGGRIGVPELLVGVPFPTAAMEIMRCAVAPQYFAQAIFGGATHAPPAARERGLIHEVVDADRLLDAAKGAARTLTSLSPPAFALTKRQTRAPFLQRMAQGDRQDDIDAAIEQIWTAPDTLARVRDYVARTLHK